MKECSQVEGRVDVRGLSALRRKMRNAERKILLDGVKVSFTGNGIYGVLVIGSVKL